MEFNKTKRGLEKGAAIFSVVMFSIQIVSYLVLAIVGLYFLTNQVIIGYQFDGYFSDYYYDPVYGYDYATGTLCLLLGIVLLTFSIVGLVFSAKLIKSPLQEDGSVKNRTGLRVTLLVFSILTGNWITAGLLIAVLCLKDFKQTAVQAVNTNPAVTTTSVNQTQPQSTSIDAKVAKLKEFKELGIIDDETYKKAIEKIIKDLL